MHNNPSVSSCRYDNVLHTIVGILVAVGSRVWNAPSIFCACGRGLLFRVSVKNGKYEKLTQDFGQLLKCILPLYVAA